MSDGQEEVSEDLELQSVGVLWEEDPRGEQMAARGEKETVGIFGGRKEENVNTGLPLGGQPQGTPQRDTQAFLSQQCRSRGPLQL